MAGVENKENMNSTEIQIHENGTDKEFKETEASCDSGFSTDSDENENVSFISTDAGVEVDSNSSGRSDAVNLDKVEDAPDMPLSRSWSFYYLNSEKKWDQRIKLISKIETIQEFWNVYNHVKLPTHISQGCDLLFFQSDIEPKWENAENCEGGRWMVEISRSDRNENLVSNWLSIILDLIGEHLAVEGVAKCYGIQFQSRKKEDKLSIWVGSGHTRAEVMNLGQWFKEGLNGHFKGDKVKFHLHKSQIAKNTSSRKYEYCV
jgi:translation initiation factor 4E